jgi:hypothetical protein
MADFSFEESSGRGNSRYGNSRMDNLLAGDMTQQFSDDQQQQQQQQHPVSQRSQERLEQRRRENFQAERNFQQQQQQNLVDVTQQNTLANAKNLGYDPSEYEVVEDKHLSSVNDVNLFIRIMLGLILFFQIFIIFRLFAHQQIS